MHTLVPPIMIITARTHKKKFSYDYVETGVQLYFNSNLSQTMMKGTVLSLDTIKTLQMNHQSLGETYLLMSQGWF